MVGDGGCAMVSPWMENGNIVEFLRKDSRADPLKLVCTVFHFVHFFIESSHSWRTRRAVFSICIV